MRIVVQRAKDAKVVVNNEVVGQIDYGYLLLVGFTHNDTSDDINYCAKKVANLRVFEDENHKMNLSIYDIKGKILSISQFTKCEFLKPEILSDKAMEKNFIAFFSKMTY